jgi:hypothetical protein
VRRDGISALLSPLSLESFVPSSSLKCVHLSKTSVNRSDAALGEGNNTVHHPRLSSLLVGRKINKYPPLFPLISIFLNRIHPKDHKLPPHQKSAPVHEENVTSPHYAKRVPHSISFLSLQTISLKSYTMHSINVVFAFLIALLSQVLAQNSINIVNWGENDQIVCFTPTVGQEGIDNVYVPTLTSNVFIYPLDSWSSM